MTAAYYPRNEHGKFVPHFCDDPNCSGELVYSPSIVNGIMTDEWFCNGLTYDRADGPLTACARTVTGPSRRVSR